MTHHFPWPFSGLQSPLSLGTEDDSSRAQVSKGKSEKEAERQAYLALQGSPRIGLCLDLGTGWVRR